MINRFKGRKLEPDESKLVHDVEKYGWAVMGIKDEPGKTGWAFTVGLYETYGHPEVILFGLKPDSRMSIVNWIGQNVRDGNSFTGDKKHDWVLEGYDCWSRPVQKKWYRDLLGYATWFYRTPDTANNFPCVQCFWPAKDGTFPWEDKSDYSSPQPLLYEEDLLAARMMHFANDEELIKAEWPFPLDPHTQAFVSRCVVEDGKPIVDVYHEHDGDWQFIGPVDNPSEDGCKVSCFHCVVERDPTLKKLAALPQGFHAWRKTPKHKWQWEEHEKESE